MNTSNSNKRGKPYLSSEILNQQDMKKNNYFFSMLALFLAFGTASFAQEQVRKLEFEAGLGYSLAMTKEEHYGSLSALLELRYNLRHSPWDVGIHYENSVAPLESVDYEALYDISPGFNPTGTTDEDIHYILPVADYNFHRGERLSYFIGGGLGMSICRIEYNTRGSFALMPRAGVELFNHLRLTLSYKYNSRGIYHYLGLSISGVLGGGRKRV